MTIHWCGTGLSSIPGLRRLLEDGRAVRVWNRTIDEAERAVGDLTRDISEMDLDALESSLGHGDIVVSMFPTDWHLPIARRALAKGAHFVSSSYITPEMQALDEAAREAGVALVNEVGLDPGIDHLMAHWLVADYRASRAYAPDNVLTFHSYCGGVPREPNAFRYKFSWSPVGVLRALRAPARCIRDHAEFRVTRPWMAVSSYSAPLASPETFEVYPNRDSVPYLSDYGFEPSWKVKEFIRGTLRLNGWAEAWSGVFEELEAMPDAEAPERLRDLSDRLWSKNAYGPGEPDRVVLCVDFRAEHEGRAVYHKTYALDAWGDARGSAMARLVSQTMSYAVEAILAHEIAAGVHAAPSDPRLVRRWLAETEHVAQYLAVVDHLR